MILPDKIVRSNRKTLSVSIDARARIIVRAPYCFPEARIFSFLKEKEEWILLQQQRAKTNQALFAPENLDGFSFPLLGSNVVVKLWEGRTVRFLNGALCLPQNNAKARLVKWLKENAKRIFSECAAFWAEKMGASYTSVSVSSARTRWGTCSAKNELRFSFRLLHARKEAIDYVVVHELSHTFHKNHQKAFWETVERFFPEWRKERRYLKQNAVFMQIF